MTTYDVIRAKVEQLGGSSGPAGIGSFNLHGGTEIKIQYDVPGPGVRNVSIVPYLIGSDLTPSTNPPPVDHQRLLAWQYTPDPGHPASPGWRCFKIGLINSIGNNPAPRPSAATLPTLDTMRQYNVRCY